MTLEEMRARLKEIAAKCTKMVKAAGDNAMSEADQKDFDVLCEEHEKLKASIDRAERVAAMNDDTNAGRGRQITPDTPSGDHAPRVSTRSEPDPQCGFSDMADFATSVMQACKPGGQVDPRLKFNAQGVSAAPSNFMFETGTSEGYEVPPAMRQTIWELVMQEDVDLLSAVDSEPTAGNQVEMPVDTDTPWSGNGVVAKWRKEAGQMTGQQFETDARDTKLHELYAFVLATDELLEDSPRLANRLTKKSAQAIRWKANESIINGTGAGQPLGYMKSGCLVTVAKESGQGADTIVANNIAKMFSRLLASSIGRAFWIANSDTLPQLMTMTIGDNLIWTPPSEGFKSAPGGFLLGRPVRFSEHAETLGDKGDIQLVDPMGYYLAYKQAGIKFASSMHLFFDYGMQAFRWTFRLGGQPYLKSAVNPNKGTNTKSHFVTLADRA